MFAYILGGLVALVRFGSHDIPVEPALVALSPGELVVLGLRDLVLPAIGLALLLAGLSVWLRGAYASAARSEPRARRWRIATPFMYFVFQCIPVLLVLPVQPSSFADAAMIAGTLVWLEYFAYTPRGHRWPTNLRWLILWVAVWASAAALFIQTQEPPTLNRADVQTTAGAHYAGWYVTQSGGSVYVGGDGRLQVIPMGRVAALTVRQPPTRPAQPASLWDTIDWPF